MKPDLAVRVVVANAAMRPHEQHSIGRKGPNNRPNSATPRRQQMDRIREIITAEGGHYNDPVLEKELQQLLAPLSAAQLGGGPLGSNRGDRRL
jgi:hypothetical protein